MSLLSKHFNVKGFSLSEVCFAILVAVMFGAAAFATNQRLLSALSNQKETTAATTVMQWRMETLRATAFSSIASAGTDSDQVSSILSSRTAQLTAANGTSTAVDPFGALGNVTEQFTIGVFPPDGSTPTVMSWNASNGVTYTSKNTTLSTAKMLRVDVLETWTGKDGRQRQRQLSTVVTTGNIGV